MAGTDVIEGHSRLAVLQRLRRTLLSQSRSSPVRPPITGPFATVAGVLDCLLAANEHGGYAVPRSSSHRPAAQAIIAGDVWERATVDLLCGSDPSGDIVTAGTFFGDFLPALSKSRTAGAQVWAFEPNRENYRCAQITLVLNDLLNVVLGHAALAERRGHATLQVRAEDGRPLGGGSHIVTDSRVVEGAQAVELVTVDEIVPADRRVAVIQFDVEGHERQALLGARDTIMRCRPLLVLETPPEERWFETHLAECRYEPAGAVCDNTVLRPAVRGRAT
jgi:FkbM family methyltransferase